METFMTSPVDPTARLRSAARTFIEAFADAALDPLVLLLWVADLHTNACLEALEPGAAIRELHADGKLTFRLIIDQASGLVSLLGVQPDGQEVVLYEVERGSAIPEAFQRAFAAEDRG
jgi:hypothetical protein